MDRQQRFPIMYGDLRKLDKVDYRLSPPQEYQLQDGRNMLSDHKNHFWASSYDVFCWKIIDPCIRSRMFDISENIVFEDPRQIFALTTD